MTSVNTGNEITNEPLETEKTRFAIYPNPTTGKFTLVRKDGQVMDQTHVELFKLSGQKVFTTEINGENTHTFNINELPAGVYILKVVSGEYLDTFKVIRIN